MPALKWFGSTTMIRKAATRLNRFHLGALALAIGGLALDDLALARDGVSGCSVTTIDQNSGASWRYTVELQVPEGGHCRIYISEDRDRKSWIYCGLKPASKDPVSATCDDPIDDTEFVDWKAKAVCGDQSFMAYCRQQR